MKAFKPFLLFLFIIMLVKGLTAQELPYPDRHSTNLNDGWLSCQSSANPNNVRGNSHWIRYDLGDTYALSASTIWNFNTPERVNSYNNEPWSLSPLVGKLDDGMRDIIIDLSLDGQVWKEFGRFNVPKAPGSSFYQGTVGPDFGGKIARYILITGVSNHGGTCYGLGEVRFNATAVTTGVNDPLVGVVMSVMPNPFSDKASLTLEGFPVGEASLNIMDVMGKTYLQSQWIISEAKTIIPLSANEMPAGLYFAQITQNGGSKTIKFEIIR
jgi:Secretion system C-terminal sorting domain